MKADRKICLCCLDGAVARADIQFVAGWTVYDLDISAACHPNDREHDIDMDVPKACPFFLEQMLKAQR